MIAAAVLLPLGLWLCRRSLRPTVPLPYHEPSPAAVTGLAGVVGAVGGIYGIGGGSILGPILVGRGMPVARVAPAALASTFVASIVGPLTYLGLARISAGNISPDWSLGWPAAWADCSADMPARAWRRRCPSDRCDLSSARSRSASLRSTSRKPYAEVMPVRTVIERGPKGKKAVAFGVDWPGWSRGAKTAERALETLESYRERYRPIARLAKMAREFDDTGPLKIVEDRVGTGSTDFWGISFSPCAIEQPPMDEADLERGITLLRACWSFFDGVAARVSPEMRKGPRGGGRDRDRIISHTIRVESEGFAEQVGLKIPEGAALTPDGLRKYRKDYVTAIRAYHAGKVEKRMKSWTLPFLIRHSAFHTLDHAWEMEDKDLSAQELT